MHAANLQKRTDRKRHTPKRQHLTRAQARNTPLPIAPPKQIRDPSPPRRIPTPPRRPLVNRQHKAESPPLRLLRWLGIQRQYRVREVGFRGGDAFAAEVGELGDLVGEHFFDGGVGEDAGLGCGGDAGVEEGGEDFCVFRVMV